MKTRLFTGLSALAAILLGCALFTSAAPAETKPAAKVRATEVCPDLPLAVAHRGGPLDFGKTEDTLGAYTETHKYGIRMWETDIQWDKAGQSVLMHDATITRTTNGTGNVKDITWSTSTVEMNDGSLLKDQTLSNLLDIANNDDTVVLIEPKVLPTPTQAQNAINIINAKGMHNKVIIDSFETANLAVFKALDPTFTYSWVTSDPEPAAAVKAVGDVYNVGYTNLTEADVDSYHALGIEVYAWTLDTPTVWANPRRSYGIDKYVTNRPAAYRGWYHWVCYGSAWTR